MENKLIIGTAQFGMAYGINNAMGQPNATAIYEMLDLALANGVQTLDSAEAYGNAHTHIGAYHERSNNKFKVITKFSATRNDLPKDIYNRVVTNIAQLHVNELEAYMFHSYNDYKAYMQHYLQAFTQLKDERKIKHLGVSVYTNSEFEAVLSDVNIDLIQLPFNVFDNNTRRGELIAKAKELGKIIHTRSVFLQGLFFMTEEKLPGKLRVMAPALQDLRSLATKLNCSLESLCLQYVCSQSNIDGVLLGIDSTEQLMANIKALKNSLSASVFNQVEHITISHPELLNPTSWYA